MKNMNVIFRKLICVTLLLVLFFSPAISILEVSAQDTGLEDDVEAEVNATAAQFQNNPGATPSTAAPTADPSKGGILPTQQTTKKSSAEMEAATEALSCSAGAIIGNAITAVVGVGIDKLTSLLGISVLKDEEVPIDNIKQKRKEIGSLVIFGIPILPSWDAIAYCLANTIITYVADSTIAWIQSGFEGKPAFVDDPTKLFQDLADYEMSNFLEELGGGVLCEPFRPYVTLGLVNSYTNNYSTRGKCTLDKVQGNVDSFLSGNSFDYNTYFAVTQNPANNPYGSYLLAEAEARNRISAGVGAVKLELDWGNGYFSWKAKDGPNAGKTVTPGKVIESQLEARLNLASDRLVLAEKFDQVISTLVNYLIKTALTETLGTIKGASN